MRKNVCECIFAIKTFLASLLISSIFVTPSVTCAANLSRGNAAELLAKSSLISLDALACEQHGYGYQVKGLQNEEAYYRKFAELGIASVSEALGQSFFHLTDTVNKYLVKTNDKYFPCSDQRVIHLGKIIDFKITGIEQEGSRARAEFTATIKSDTPFGDVLLSNDSSVDGTAEYKLYDDGWRVSGFYTKQQLNIFNKTKWDR